jgi:hypothetical protein
VIAPKRDATMSMDSRCADERGDGAQRDADELFTGAGEVAHPEGAESLLASADGARRIVCTRVKGARPLSFLGRDQTVVGSIAYLPRPGRALCVYSAEGVCVLQSSRIRLLMHGPGETLVVTKNSTYRVTFVDDA